MSDILALSQIKVPGTAVSKDDAIREAGALLVGSGAVTPAYVDAMFERFAEIAVNDLIRRGELDKSRRDEILARRYTEEQVLKDWFPGGETPHSQG